MTQLNFQFPELSKVDPREVLEIYNGMFSNQLPKALGLSKRRTIKVEKLSSVLKSSNDWRRYFKCVMNQKFLLGQNELGWQVNFDWLLDETNLLKVAELRYLPKAS